MLYWYCEDKFCLVHSLEFKRGLTIDGQNCSVLIGFNKRITSCERWILKYLFLFTSLFISQHHLFCLFSKTIDHFTPFLIVSKHNCHKKINMFVHCKKLDNGWLNPKSCANQFKALKSLPFLCNPQSYVTAFPAWVWWGIWIEGVKCLIKVKSSPLQANDSEVKIYII